MTLMISLFTIYFPVKYYLTNYKDLMDINPDEKLTEKLDGMLKKGPVMLFLLITASHKNNSSNRTKFKDAIPSGILFRYVFHQKQL
jgi:hypothetical protein